MVGLCTFFADAPIIVAKGSEYSIFLIFKLLIHISNLLDIVIPDLTPVLLLKYHIIELTFPIRCYGSLVDLKSLRAILCLVL